MAHLIEMLFSLPESLESSPINHMVLHNHLKLWFQGSCPLLSFLLTVIHGGVEINMMAKHLYIQNKIIF